MTSLTIQSKGQDDSSHSVYYQKTFYNKGRFEIYGWTSYDLIWADETGIGINILLYKRKKFNQNKKLNKKQKNEFNHFKPIKPNKDIIRNRF